MVAREKKEGDYQLVNLLNTIITLSHYHTKSIFTLIFFNMSDNLHLRMIFREATPMTSEEIVSGLKIEIKLRCGRKIPNYPFVDVPTLYM